MYILVLLSILPGSGLLASDLVSLQFLYFWYFFCVCVFQFLCFVVFFCIYVFLYFCIFVFHHHLVHRHLPLSVQINGHQAATRLSFQPHHFSLSFKYLYLLYIMIQTPFKYNSNFKYPSNIFKTSLTVNFFPFHLVWNIHSSTNCRFCRSSVDFLLHP